MIVALNESCCGRSDLTDEAEEELGRLAPGLIPEFVRNVYAWGKSRQGGERNSGPAGFDWNEPSGVGRNEPCSRGSGRKYQRSCGAH